MPLPLNHRHQMAGGEFKTTVHEKVTELWRRPHPHLPTRFFFQPWYCNPPLARPSSTSHILVYHLQVLDVLIGTLSANWVKVACGRPLTSLLAAARTTGNVVVCGGPALNWLPGELAISLGIFFVVGLCCWLLTSTDVTVFVHIGAELVISISLSTSFSTFPPAIRKTGIRKTGMKLH